MQISNKHAYNGILRSPSSKSFMQRAVAIALLAEGTTQIYNPCFCKDVDSILEIAKCLGAEVKCLQDKVSITPNSESLHSKLNVGESGLGIRMFSAIAALYSKTVTLVGEGSLKSRPMHMLEQPLTDLGVEIKTNNGLLPITVKGPLRGGNAKVDGSLSSQMLSGLLIALPKTNSTSLIEVTNLKSRPYVDMTLAIMKEFGVVATHDNYSTFKIEGNQNYLSKKYHIEGDWSGSAFHLVGAAIAGDVTLTGINLNSSQADVKIMDALRLAGADLIVEDGSVRVIKNQLNAFCFDATHCPDLFPPLSNLAVACEGTSVFKGVKRLVHKESNRALAMQQEWLKLGVDVQIVGDEMHIKGVKVLGGKMDSHNDHRIAMMGAVASLVSENPITISGYSSVGKSYPNFFKDFKFLSS
jgi:3-phosphoshikimate 1-carboxyvinyltransferase